MANDIDLTGIPQRTAGEWLTKGAYADLGVPLVRVSDLAEIVRRGHPQPCSMERLRKFLDSAAGEGFELDGVDAADLFIEIFGAPE